MNADVNAEAALCAKIARSGAFDGAWYLAHNPDVASAGMDPIVHYTLHGHKEGRAAPPGFNLNSFAARPGASGQPCAAMAESGAGRLSEPIPVVFAANENYAPCMSVAIASLIHNASPQNIYEIYIFYASMKDETLALLQSQQTENVIIKPLCVAREAQDLMRHAYVSRYGSVETYFRILITRLLANYPKVIYLDGDIAVNRDIADLFHVDITYSLLAAVKNHIWDNSWIRRIQSFFEKPNAYYFNAGVLLINNINFLKFNIYDEFMRRARSGVEYICWDQDIMNIICNRNVKPLSRTWNLQWPYFSYNGFNKNSDIEIFREYAMYFTNPAIIHFCGERKPWTYDDNHFTSMFWRYAMLSPFFKQLENMCTLPLGDILAKIEKSYA